jgi:hypothetical protein
MIEYDENYWNFALISTTREVSLFSFKPPRQISDLPPLQKRGIGSLPIFRHSKKIFVAFVVDIKNIIPAQKY